MGDRQPSFTRGSYNNNYRPSYDGRGRNHYQGDNEVIARGPRTPRERYYSPPRAQQRSSRDAEVGYHRNAVVPFGGYEDPSAARSTSSARLDSDMTLDDIVTQNKRKDRSPPSLPQKPSDRYHDLPERPHYAHEPKRYKASDRVPHDISNVTSFITDPTTRNATNTYLAHLRKKQGGNMEKGLEAGADYFQTMLKSMRGEKDGNAKRGSVADVGVQLEQVVNVEECTTQTDMTMLDISDMSVRMDTNADEAEGMSEEPEQLVEVKLEEEDDKVLLLEEFNDRLPRWTILNLGDEFTSAFTHFTTARKLDTKKYAKEYKPWTTVKLIDQGFRITEGMVSKQALITARNHLQEEHANNHHPASSNLDKAILYEKEFKARSGSKEFTVAVEGRIYALKYREVLHTIALGKEDGLRGFKVEYKGDDADSTSRRKAMALVMAREDVIRHTFFQVNNIAYEIEEIKERMVGVLAEERPPTSTDKEPWKKRKETWQTSALKGAAEDYITECTDETRRKDLETSLKSLKPKFENARRLGDRLHWLCGLLGGNVGGVYMWPDSNSGLGAAHAYPMKEVLEWILPGRTELGRFAQGLNSAVQYFVTGQGDVDSVGIKTMTDGGIGALVKKRDFEGIMVALGIGRELMDAN